MKMDKELRDRIIVEIMIRKGSHMMHNDHEKELKSYREELDKMTDVEIVDELSSVCYSDGMADANLY